MFCETSDDTCRLVAVRGTPVWECDRTDIVGVYIFNFQTTRVLRPRNEAPYTVETTRTNVEISVKDILY